MACTYKCLGSGDECCDTDQRNHSASGPLVFLAPYNSSYIQHNHRRLTLCYAFHYDTKSRGAEQHLLTRAGGRKSELLTPSHCQKVEVRKKISHEHKSKNWKTQDQKTPRQQLSASRADLSPTKVGVVKHHNVIRNGSPRRYCGGIPVCGPFQSGLATLPSTHSSDSNIRRQTSCHAASHAKAMARTYKDHRDVHSHSVVILTQYQRT
jgi:hypothetical protein